MTESDLQAEVIAIARGLRLYVFHSTDSHRDIGPGFPDLVIAGLDGVLFAELKSAAGQLSTEQTKWRYRLLAAGQQYYLWRPRDLASGRIESTLRSM